MTRRKVFGYGGRLHCWAIKRRIDRAGGIEALADTFKTRQAARERIDT